MGGGGEVPAARARAGLQNRERTWHIVVAHLGQQDGMITM